ncbi:capsid protein [Leuconostoc mesenteroides]|uniref:minor capsid protein n=1 Tax=Leuconostoc mesenteroides TaxID=1245 RepID=UPI000FFE2E9B|nr:minor capsid protein [Leuconostoc mesenteroides]QAT27264.1 capsid protein [Leuconostoc mesenteroides]
MAIKLDFDRANHIMAGANKKASQFKAANQAMMAMERFVPKSDMQKQNRLRTASNVSNDGEHIIYTMPYARAQFFGVINGSQIRNYTTPGTSSRWDKRLIGDKALMKTVTDVYVKELMK